MSSASRADDRPDLRWDIRHRRGRFRRYFRFLATSRSPKRQAASPTRLTLIAGATAAVRQADYRLGGAEPCPKVHPDICVDRAAAQMVGPRTDFARVPQLPPDPQSSGRPGALPSPRVRWGRSHRRAARLRKRSPGVDRRLAEHGRLASGVAISPFSAARAASRCPATTSASLLTMIKWRQASMARTAWRTAASGWPVASTTASIGRSSTTARSVVAM